jgi:hypothetical protein
VIQDPLVEELARLDKDRRREIVAAAERERQHRIRLAIRRVRSALLPSLNERRAAQAIDDAVRRRRTSFQDNPVLRIEIECELQEELGSLDDIPGMERIRQLLRN